MSCDRGGEPSSSISNTIDIISEDHPIEPVSRAGAASRNTGGQPNGAAETTGTEIDIILRAYDPNRHYAYVEKLASDSFEGRLAGSPGTRLAAGVIEQHFSELGLEPWGTLGLDSYRHGFSLDGVADDNIIGVIPGTDPAAGYIILAAHYDHLGTSIYGPPYYNAANDNAAGVGAVMEAARLFTATGGSYLGVWDDGSSAAAPLIEALREAGGHTGVDIVEEGTATGSDAQPFNWQFGIPAVTVDWDWGSDPFVFRPYYHTVEDDTDKSTSQSWRWRPEQYLRDSGCARRRQTDPRKG